VFLDLDENSRRRYRIPHGDAKEAILQFADVHFHKVGDLNSQNGHHLAIELEVLQPSSIV
jgi:hypothetical protein